MTDEHDVDDATPTSGRSRRPSVWLVLFGVVAIGTAIFILQNGERVPAEFLWLDAEIRLWVAIIASICLGVVLDRLVLATWRRSRRREQ